MISFGCPLKDAYGSDFKKRKKQKQVFATPDSTQESVSSPVPFDRDVNDKHKELFESVEVEYKNLINKLEDRIVELSSQLKFNKSNSKSTFEPFSLGIENDQFNELLLYICTGIFFIFLFDYMYSFGKKSF